MYGAVRFVRFSYYKTVNRTVPCGVVHYYLRCGAVMPFCRWFWCGFCCLVNTPNSGDSRNFSQDVLKNFS